MHKIATCLWFDRNAGEAAEFYVSVFKNAKITDTSYYGEGAPLPKGTVLTVAFEIEGQNYLGLNGGPHFKLSPAISVVVRCKDQAEIDDLWERLSAGGAKSQCGWLTDRFGLSWQIVPVRLMELLSHPDKDKAKRVMAAMLQMSKIEIDVLERA